MSMVEVDLGVRDTAGIDRLAAETVDSDERSVSRTC